MWPVYIPLIVGLAPGLVYWLQLQLEELASKQNQHLLISVFVLVVFYIKTII